MLNYQRVWPIEIVDLPNLKVVIFHSYVNVYQRVHLESYGHVMFFLMLGKSVVAGIPTSNKN